jgi:hypothetical protein
MPWMRTILFVYSFFTLCGSTEETTHRQVITYLDSRLYLESLKHWNELNKHRPYLRSKICVVRDSQNCLEDGNLIKKSNK